MTSKPRTSTRARAPITSHPLFPAGIAVWFAALFGMGSLALRAQLLEDGVRWLNLDLLVPAAAPPLGFTARLMIAMLFALSGALAGFVLARIVSARSRRSARYSDLDIAPAAAPRARPIDKAGRGRPAAPKPAADDDDNDDLARLEAAREAVPTRKRGPGGLTASAGPGPFAAPAATGPSILNLGELEAVEPLAPNAWGTGPVASLPATAATEAPATGTPDRMPAEPAVLIPAASEPDRPEGNPPRSDAPAPFELAPFELSSVSPLDPATALPIAGPDESAPPPAVAVAPSLFVTPRPTHPTQAAPDAPAPERIAQDVATIEPTSPAVEPSECADLPEPVSARIGGPAALPTEPSPPAVSPSRRLVPKGDNAADMLRSAPLASLGVVELVERFALALAARGAVAAPRPVPLPSQPKPHPRAAEPWPQPGPVEPGPETANTGAQGMRHPAPEPSPRDPIGAPTTRASITRVPTPPATPAPFAAPISQTAARPFDMPAMLRSPLPGGNVEWFEDDEPAEALGSLLPPRMASAPAGAVALAQPRSNDPRPAPDGSDPLGLARVDDNGPEIDEGDDALDDRWALHHSDGDRADGFSSLLDMKPAARTRPVDPATLPGRLPGGGGAAEEAVTEEALRSALAALQRMSGAA